MSDIVHVPSKMIAVYPMQLWVGFSEVCVTQERWALDRREQNEAVKSVDVAEHGAWCVYTHQTARRIHMGSFTDRFPFSDV